MHALQFVVSTSVSQKIPVEHVCCKIFKLSCCEILLHILRLLEEGHLIRISQVLRTLLSFFIDAVVEMQYALPEFLVTIAQKPHAKMTLSYSKKIVRECVFIEEMGCN